MAGAPLLPFLLGDGLEEHKSLLRTNGIAERFQLLHSFRHTLREAGGFILVLRFAGAGGPGMSSQLL